jgi:hypothetical protein
MSDPVDTHERARQIADAVKSADDKRRADQEAKDQLLEKVLAKLDDCASKLDEMGLRMDSFEKERDEAKRAKRRKDDDDDTRKKDDDDDDDDAFAEQPNPEIGMAKQTVADAQTRADDAARRHETLMADAQARADAIAIEFGEKAPPPLSGEKLFDYKRRLLRRYQRFSPDFKEIDLHKVTDPAVFFGIENRVYADAVKAAGMPEVGVGQLRAVTKTQHGHQITTFYGSPSAWMNQFAPPSRRFLTKIRTKFDD